MSIVQSWQSSVPGSQWIQSLPFPHGPRQRSSSWHLPFWAQSLKLSLLLSVPWHQYSLTLWFELPVPSVSKRSNASLISCFCSSVNYDLAFLAGLTGAWVFLKVVAIIQIFINWLLLVKPNGVFKGGALSSTLHSPTPNIRLGSMSTLYCEFLTLPISHS